MHDVRLAIREGLRNFWRDRTLSLAMVGSLAIAVFALGGVALIAVNIDFLLKRWESKVELVAFLRHDVGADQARQLLKRIALLPEVRETRLLSEKNSWTELFSEEGETINIGQIPLDEILPPTIVIKLAAGNYHLPQVKRIAAQITALEGVDEVKFEEVLLERYVKFRREMLASAAGMNVLWFLIFWLVIANIARLASSARAGEIQAMHMLGASTGMLRRILSIEGLMQGMVGGGAGIGMLAGMSLFISGKMERSLQFPVGVFLTAFVLGPSLALLGSWRMFRKAAMSLIVVLAVALTAAASFAASSANELDAEVARYQKEVERLKSELQQNKSAVRQIGQQEQTVVEDLEQIEKEIESLEKNLRTATAKMTKNKSSIQTGQGQLVQYEKELDDSRRELEQWLKLLCVFHPPSITEAVLFDVPQSEMTLRAEIVNRLAKKEAEAMARVEDIRGQYDQQEADLRKHSELDSLYIETMNLQMQQSLEKKKAREELLAKLRRQKSIYVAAIGDLEASSQNLQRLIDSMRSGQLRGGSGASAPFGEMKGLLPWPVEGKVAAPFGRIRNPDSETFTRHLGLDLAAPAGSEIRVIHDGNVVYCDWFSGYGKLVIIDHGNGYSSVYSHCSEILVKKGDFVRAGTPLALVGETGSLKGPFLYFEIRENGQPVDPLVWLQRRM